MSAPAKDCRLPNHTKPFNYALHIVPDLASFTFSGTCVANVEVITGPVSTIQVHAKDLTVSRVVADGSNESTDQVRCCERTVPCSAMNSDPYLCCDCVCCDGCDGCDGKLAQSLDTDVDILTVTFGTPLAAGKHAIEFMYTGLITDSMAGLYRSSYTTSSGEKKWMAATQVCPLSFFSCDPLSAALIRTFCCLCSV
jgi:aminopeptidase N